MRADPKGLAAESGLLGTWYRSAASGSRSARQQSTGATAPGSSSARGTPRASPWTTTASRSCQVPIDTAGPTPGPLSYFWRLLTWAEMI